MLTDAEMTPRRFLIAMQNKQLYNRIMTDLSEGRVIQVTTYTHSKIYTKPEQFKLGKTGVYAQRGKHWDCINYCSIRSYPGKR